MTITAKPKRNETWTHIRSNVDYVVTGLGRMKIAEGEWVDSVTYMSAGGAVFTRDLTTFVVNFKRQP